MSGRAAAIRGRVPDLRSIEPAPFHYLDNAATGQICRPAAEALLAFETRNRANVKRGVYRLAEAATMAFHEARAAVAAYLGRRGSGRGRSSPAARTLAINTVRPCVRRRLRPGRRDPGLSELEHHSNIVPWQLLPRAPGRGPRVLPVTEEGRLDLDRLERRGDRAHAG